MSNQHTEEYYKKKYQKYKFKYIQIKKVSKNEEAVSL